VSPDTTTLTALMLSLDDALRQSTALLAQSCATRDLSRTADLARAVQHLSDARCIADSILMLQGEAK
jgi:hypothetical protein